MPSEDMPSKHQGRPLAPKSGQKPTQRPSRCEEVTLSARALQEGARIAPQAAAIKERSKPNSQCYLRRQRKPGPTSNPLIMEVEEMPFLGKLEKPTIKKVVGDSTSLHLMKVYTIATFAKETTRGSV